MVELSERKSIVIKAVEDINDVQSIALLEKTIQSLENKKSRLARLQKPIRTRLDLDQIKKEQGWKGHNRIKMMNIIKEINIQEPIETLLSQL